jgi:site-specific DNA-cytosine methylase
MKILSLFDGISCCRVALNRANIPVDTYYASEIDKHAITVAQKNFPDTIQLGDVTKWKSWDIDFASIDIVTAGFPCQAWSVAGSQLGDKDPRGALFWTTLDIISHIKKRNPKVIFLLENVKMKREFEAYISHHTEQALGKVNKYLINSALVSAQNRQRYYWTNIDGVKQPEDRGILLKGILENPLDEPINYSSSGRGNGIVESRVTENPKKAMTLTATGYTNRSMTKVIKNNEIEIWHNLSIIETERLQTLPDNYTAGISDTQRYKCLGNGWTVDVIAHIFKNIT